MQTYISHPTIEYINKEKLYELLRQCDPELFMIKIALDETGVNPIIIPKIIRSLSNLAVGAGYGKVQVFMSARIITSIEGIETNKVNEKANK